MNPAELSPDVQDETTKRQRSVWVWIILGWAVWGVIGVLSIWWNVLRPPSDAELQMAAAVLGPDVPLPRMTPIAAAVATINALVLLVGAWKLFMLRAIAVRIFWISVAVAVVAVPINVVTIDGYLALMRTPFGLGPMLFSLVLYVLLLWYSTRLLRRGVLQ